MVLPCVVIMRWKLRRSGLTKTPEKLLAHPDTSFKTPTETIESYDAVGEIDVPHILTWADTDRDLTAWTGNDIQKDALAAVYALEKKVMKTKDEEVIETWRKLQTSDHFYYMCTKWSNDGDVHAYFSPYESPYDAYVAFMNALSDLQLRVSYALDSKQNQRTSFEKNYRALFKRIFWYIRKWWEARYSSFKRYSIYQFYASYKNKKTSS